MRNLGIATSCGSLAHRASFLASTKTVLWPDPLLMLVRALDVGAMYFRVDLEVSIL